MKPQEQYPLRTRPDEAAGYACALSPDSEPHRKWQAIIRCREYIDKRTSLAAVETRGGAHGWGLDVAAVKVGAEPVHDFRRAPVALFVGAAVALLLSVACLVPRSAVLSGVGYLLAPIVVTVLVSLYRAADIRASQSAWYLAQPGQKRLSTIILLVSFVVGLAHAWIIATEVAKAFAS